MTPTFVRRVAFVLAGALACCAVGAAVLAFLILAAALMTALLALRLGLAAGALPVVRAQELRRRARAVIRKR